MFTEYLISADFFRQRAEEYLKVRSERKELSDDEIKRYYQAAIFFSVSAMESYLNYIGEILNHGESINLNEVALLTDKKIDTESGQFILSEKAEFHRTEEKLRYLIDKFCPGFDYAHIAQWSQFCKLKDFRDDLVHPRDDEDPYDISLYKDEVERGLKAVVYLMNIISVGFFKRPLRRRILEVVG